MSCYYMLVFGNSCIYRALVFDSSCDILNVVIPYDDEVTTGW